MRLPLFFLEGIIMARPQPVPLDRTRVIWVRTWTSPEDAQEAFYLLAAADYDRVRDLIRQGSKDEALLFTRQVGEEVDLPRLEVDDF
jgi:hypothetical protein